ncbi:MAG TPA: WD40 repeat domain-containing protein [Planctomycetota bacterium]
MHARLEFDGQETMCCDWSPDGASFAIGGHDGVVRVSVPESMAAWRRAAASS